MDQPKKPKETAQRNDSSTAPAARGLPFASAVGARDAAEHRHRGGDAQRGQARGEDREDRLPGGTF